MGWHYLKATIEAGFWRQYQDLIRTEVVPYQWKALKDEIPDAPKSHSVENFRIAAGVAKGEYDGMVFQDSDLYKWLEAAGHLMGHSADGTIKQWIDEAVELIARTQQPDGYLDTYFTVKEPSRRWKNLREAHELYCAGHLIEAGVAVHRSTGNQKILDVVCRLADHIDRTFGREEGKIHGYPGHEEVELALVKLYRITGEPRYLNLAKYFVDERGKAPHFFDEEQKNPGYFSIFGINSDAYSQSHIPVREQTDAVGHAVRAMYFYIAVADLALETGDETLISACKRLWDSTTSRQMYITGGIGSAARREAFTTDYDLPNDTAYAETCAAIGLFVFSHRMALLENDSRYADVMERTLYNGIISGLAIDGHSYFYVNPLEVVPEVCDSNPTYAHVKYRRQPWYGCACCPPNIARLVASLGEYVYHVSGSTLYADLFHEGSIECSVDGKAVLIKQETGYPWTGNVTFEYAAQESVTFDFAIRIPGWCRAPELRINGERIDPAVIGKRGYAHINRPWRQGDRVQLSLQMPAERVYSNPKVRHNWGKVAIQRGPLVYCLEQEDNGSHLHTAELPVGSALTSQFRPDMLGGITVVTAKGTILTQDGQFTEHGQSTADGHSAADDPLYSASIDSPSIDERELVFVPYYAWANRSPGSMTVWVRERKSNVT